MLHYTSNGRALIGKFGGNILQFEEVYRFKNRQVFTNKTLYWDFISLFSRLKISIKKSADDFRNISSIAVDTWCVDYGFLNSDLELISNPIDSENLRGIK